MVGKNTRQPNDNGTFNYNGPEAIIPATYKMPEQYIYMHNFAKELVNDYTKVQAKYEAHDRDVKMVISRYKAIKARMRYLEDSAKRVLTNMDPYSTNALRILEEAKEFKQLLGEFHKDVDKLSKETDSMNEVFVPLDDKDRQLTEIFDKYKQFKQDLYSSNSLPEVEACAYEAKEQEFLGSLAHIGRKQNEFIGVCNMVIDRYNLLIEEVEKTYFQWQRCDVLLQMIKQTMVSPVDITLVCLN